MDVRGIEEEIRRYFRENPAGVVSVYLFGSRARGEERSGSDVDVAVLFERDPEATFDALPLGIEADLEDRIGLPVQVVALNLAPADLVYRVLRDGRLVLDLDPSRRVEFEVRRRNEYYDMLPILEEYRRARATGPP